jgi:hypothetical protein
MITATVLFLVAVAILPVNEASARECNDDNNRIDDNNDDAHSTTCTHQQGSNNHDHSNTKDTTPFLLPFP